MAENQDGTLRRAFLLQGFTPHTHATALKRLLAPSDLERILISVAFATRKGVDRIAPEMTAAKGRLDVYVGIRNGVSTREGLVALMETGAHVRYVDTGTENLLFHPKIYLVRGKNKAGMILGSANLTAGGLINNIESSLELDLDPNCESDFSFMESVFSEFDGLESTYPEHVVRVERIADLDALQKQGRLVDETSLSLASKAARSKGDATNLPVIELQTLRTTVPPDRKTDTEGSDSIELLWRSKALTERDLGIPSGANIHPTGSINLDKGLLDDSVDYRHYFRDKVFGAMDWKSTAHSSVEEARAEFRLIVKGVDRGERTLRIGHTADTTLKTYLQHNAMTRLSWGMMKEFVADRDLIGRTLSLYRNVSDSKRFVIRIE